MTKPSSICERTVDFMSVSTPRCIDLCGIAKPAHVEGPKHLKSLLAEPSAAPWQLARDHHLPASKTMPCRTEGWRYIRYANWRTPGELYDETADPYEWTNLANKPEHDTLKAQLAKHLPTTNLPAGDEAKRSRRANPRTRRKRRSSFDL